MSWCPASYTEPEWIGQHCCKDTRCDKQMWNTSKSNHLKRKHTEVQRQASSAGQRMVGLHVNQNGHCKETCAHSPVLQVPVYAPLYEGMEVLGLRCPMYAGEHSGQEELDMCAVQDVP